MYYIGLILYEARIGSGEPYQAAQLTATGTRMYVLEQWLALNR
eukprot:SAG25_NODE_14046_length_259_cov_2.531250_1_plen_42_part_10